MAGDFDEAMRMIREQVYEPPVMIGVVIDLSAQFIGDPTTGVWCATCNLPSAVVADVAVLMTQVGVESYEVDPVAKLMTIHVCEGCGNAFELPDSPTLRNGSRD